MRDMMGWIKERKDELEAFAHLAIVVGALASLCFSMISLYYSCQAKNVTEKLKADAEQVEINFEAKFDHKEGIKLIPADKMHRFPVLTLCVYLTITNRNPYRSIIIEGVEPAFVDGSMPSELGMQLMEGDEEGPKSFVVSSLSVAKKKVSLSWPIDDELCKFTKLLLKKKPHLTLSDFKLEVGKHCEVVQASEKHRQIVFHLRTTPKSQYGREVTAKIALY
jgi:hypothetical protein